MENHKKYHCLVFLKLMMKSKKSKSFSYSNAWTLKIFFLLCVILYISGVIQYHIDYSEMDTIQLICNLDNSNDEIIKKILIELKTRSNLKYLVPVLQKGDIRFRINVLRSLVRYSNYNLDLNDRSIIDLFIELLNDNHPTIKILALKILDQYRSGNTTQAIIPCLNDKNMEVCLIATRILAKREDPSLLNYFLPNLKHKKIKIRMETIRALSKPVFRKVLTKKMVSLIKDKDWRIRYQAVLGMGRIGDKTFIPFLIDLIKDQDSLVASTAVYSLGEIGHESAVPALVKAVYINTLSIQRNALNALSKIGTSGFDFYIKVALDKNLNQELRTIALYEIGSIRDKGVVPFLIKLLQDEDSNIRRSTLLALMKIKDPRALEPIRKISENDRNSDVRRIAEDAIKILESIDRSNKQNVHNFLVITFYL